MLIATIFLRSVLPQVLIIPLLLMMFVLQCFSIGRNCSELPTRATRWYEQKTTHVLKTLNQQETQKIVLLGSELNFESLLDPLLIPRVPDTENWVEAKNYLIKHMEKLEWTVETDPFQDDTPIGKIRFENIIATLNPDAPRRLVFACHFDSKYDEDEFIGATDSAVSCAQMLHLAYAMKKQLNVHKNRPNNVTLQYIFFDGEEAMKQWSDSDSLYGSRHLAQKWEETPYPPGNTDGTSELNRIDVLMLLDLIGAPRPKFHCFFKETSRLYTALVNAEKRLKRYNYLAGPGKFRMFPSGPFDRNVEDDHVPFMKRHVNILHLISVPFPQTWHSAGDTKESLDFDTIENLNRIFRIFVVRYLHLQLPS